MYINQETSTHDNTQTTYYEDPHTCHPHITVPLPSQTRLKVTYRPTKAQVIPDGQITEKRREEEEERLKSEIRIQEEADQRR